MAIIFPKLDSWQHPQLYVTPGHQELEVLALRWHHNLTSVSVDNKIFRKYCGELGITNRYSTPAYPQGNGQTKAVNKVILSGLKKKLDDAKGKWVEELPLVL